RHRRGGAAQQVRLPARRLPLRRAAARWHRARRRPADHAGDRRGLDPRRDRLPEDDQRAGPDVRRTERRVTRPARRADDPQHPRGGFLRATSTTNPLLAALALLAAGCSSTPPGTENPGRGVVTVDLEVPPDVPTAARPQWHVGDRFVYRRGGLVQVSFRVVTASDEGYELEEETTGLRNSFTVDLGVRGQELPSDSSMTRTLDPFDASLSWPLWPGKKWVCHFVRRGGAVDVPIL